MISKPLVSVVMPNYNNEAFLVEAIDSILNQTFTDFEFLIIDDGSTDGSIDIINSYSDQRIRLIVKEKNSGIVDALNIGLDEAVGEYMIRMDGDDISVKDRFEILVDFMKSHPDICVCSSDLQTFGSEKDQLWKLGTSVQKNKAEMLFSSPIGHASSIFKMELFKNGKLRYEKGYPYIEDYKLFTRLNKVCNMFNISKPLYLVRINDASSTFINRDTHAERLSIIYKELLSELEINCDDSEASKKNLRIHFELARKQAPSFLYKDYFDWCQLLIRKNKELKIYPLLPFEEVVKEKLQMMEFKMLDKKPMEVLSMLRRNKKLKKSLIRYAVGAFKKNLKK